MTLLQNIKKGLIPAKLTVRDLYALTEAGIIGEQEHIELIDGEIVPMAAAKSSPHERMKSKLIRALVPIIPDSARLFVEPTVSLNTANTIEPDLAVWPMHIESEDVRGQHILLAIEVSVSSLPYDLREKASRYARWHVQEYWVIDAIRQTLRRHRCPEDGRYADVTTFAEDEPVHALFDPRVTITLASLD